jgi:hypothetical protein
MARAACWLVGHRWRCVLLTRAGAVFSPCERCRAVVLRTGAHTSW